MPLLLCVHTVEQVTAKVPFSMMVLLGHMQKESIPPELKVRQVGFGIHFLSPNRSYISLISTAQHIVDHNSPDDVCSVLLNRALHTSDDV